MKPYSPTLLLFVLLLGACSKNNSAPVLFDESSIAPYTENVLETLPSGLKGDAENQRHTNENLRGDDDAGRS